MPSDDALILVVDDEPPMRRILERVLTGEGYRVIVARDGGDALRMFARHSPDVVLLDLMMPGINGRNVCRQIRESSPTTRIIYLSAKAVLVDSVELKEYRDEADAFIAKPATSKEILSKISSLLSDRQ